MEFKEWASSVKKVYNSQIFLDDLLEMKKIRRKDYKMYCRKLSLIRCKNYINSPHLEGNDNLKKSIVIDFIESHVKKYGDKKDKQLLKEIKETKTK